MRVLVTGAAGQVGARVVECLDGHDVLAAAHDVLDLADRDQVEQVVGTFAPHAVINAAAMTNVDECERDPDGAFAINALGVRHLAVAAARAGTHVVHVSTDYVFDGTSSRPYDEWDAVGPLSEYGRSKLAGERELEEHARSWTLVRTSWVFGKRGSDLISWAFGAYERGELDGVLADQQSVPTYAPDLAELLVRFAMERRDGLFHATSGSEACTRHELVTEALRHRGLDTAGVLPITTAPDRPARRPVFSALDNRALRLGGFRGLRPWRDALAEYVKEWPSGATASPAPGLAAERSVRVEQRAPARSAESGKS
jgi:dTDP-4-dehydrorhamnose reductase